MPNPGSASSPQIKANNRPDFISLIEAFFFAVIGLPFFTKK
jgi:hypothetical protein